VLAALANPERTVRKMWATREALVGLDIPPVIPITYADVADLGRLVPGDAPHQGLIIEVEPLEDIWLGDLLEQGQGEDDRRPAAAFDALGIVTQDRHSPPESGAVARTASGALEIVPWVRVVNLSRALGEIAEAGFWRVGLAGEATETLGNVIGAARVALVLGAEGEGMRHNTMQHCDQLARLPISPRIESLNVSNAAAIALYAVAARD
jgi:23S rRNA (guanosine2251-2'-O)-methyltransferase